MQHLLQVSRKVDYGLRAMIHLAGLPSGVRVTLADIAVHTDVSRDFAAKIIKALADAGLVQSQRGPHGGVALARSPADMSFLDVIEAVDGPVMLNVCLDTSEAEVDRSCSFRAQCTMQAVWRAGQERMLDVYRSTRLSDLVTPLPVPLTVGGVTAIPTTTDGAPC